MSINAFPRLLCGSMLLLVFALPSHAIHHLMQVEQIIGSVDGDTSAQAIQLRMRSPGQNVMSGSQMWVYDAAGANPVLIHNFNDNVDNGDTGDRVLLTTAAFNALTTPNAVADYPMTNPIPASYLAAGRLTFEEDDGTVLWSIAWGGEAYTGSNDGVVTNDDDGDFGPPFPSALPAAGRTALLLTLGATGTSSTNENDYTFTTGNPVFVNNAGTSFVVTGNVLSLTVKRPKATDVAVTGEKLKIRWKKEGSLGKKVVIDLFKGNKRVTKIKKKTKNDGKFNWVVPENTKVGTDYRVRVKDKKTGVNDFSAFFQIE